MEELRCQTRPWDIIDISLYKLPATQQQWTEVAPDQKEDKKRPNTPPLIFRCLKKEIVPTDDIITGHEM